MNLKYYILSEAFYMSKDLVSVITPCYNGAAYVSQTIESVLSQTYPHWEMIVVDDGSKDSSAEIVRSYAEKDPRISVIHKENGGQNSARNAAIDQMLQEAAEEDFVIFLDSDDSIRSNTLQVLQDALTRSGCDMVVYGYEWVFEGKVLSHCPKPFIGQIESKRELYRLVFSNSEYNALWRKAVPRNLIKIMRETYQNRYDYIRIGEDLLQSISLYKHCEKAVFIPDELYAYTLNPNSVSYNRAAYGDFLDPTVRRLVLEFLEQQPEWTQADMDHYLRYCRKLLVKNLLQVEEIRATRKEKIRWFEQIKADAYFQKILQTTKTGDRMLNLLKKSQYGLLLSCLKAYNLAVRVKQTGRKLLAR
jgi:glycosyltransferase involved in cell wall biosynthesis